MADANARTFARNVNTEFEKRLRITDRLTRRHDKKRYIFSHLCSITISTLSQARVSREIFRLADGHFSQFLFHAIYRNTLLTLKLSIVVYIVKKKNHERNLCNNN